MVFKVHLSSALSAPTLIDFFPLYFIDHRPGLNTFPGCLIADYSIAEF
jgi:hypothetical protein